MAEATDFRSYYLKAVEELDSITNRYREITESELFVANASKERLSSPSMMSASFQTLSGLLQDWKKHVISSTEVDTANPVKIAESADYVKQVSVTVRVFLLNHKLTIDEKGDGYLLDVATAMNAPLNSAKKAAEKARDHAMKDLEPEQASDALTDYYAAFTDIQVISKNLHGLATEVSNELSSQQEEKNDQNFLSRNWNGIKRIVTTIGDRISKSIGKMKGFAHEAGSLVIESLRKFENSFIAGFEAIQDGLNAISDRFQNFIITLIDQMFKLLSRFSSIAAERGFAISRIEMDVPSIKFDFISLLGLPVPIPKIDPPKMIVTIEPKKKPSDS